MFSKLCMTVGTIALGVIVLACMLAAPILSAIFTALAIGYVITALVIHEIKDS